MMKAILKTADPPVIESICELTINLLKSHVKLTPKSKRFLEKYKRELRCLSCSKRSLKSKRKLLVQKGHGFIPALIATVISSVASTLADRYLNKKNE